MSDILYVLTRWHIIVFLCHQDKTNFRYNVICRLFLILSLSSTNERVHPRVLRLGEEGFHCHTSKKHLAYFYSFLHCAESYAEESSDKEPVVVTEAYYVSCFNYKGLNLQFKHPDQYKVGPNKSRPQCLWGSHLWTQFVSYWVKVFFLPKDWNIKVCNFPLINCHLFVIQTSLAGHEGEYLNDVDLIAFGLLMDLLLGRVIVQI